MSLLGYARVSTTDQSLEIQIAQLTEAGAEKIFAEKTSGTSTEAREQLRAMETFAREGDILLVTRLDRLARSLTDLVNLLGRLVEKGVDLRCIQQGGLDTTSSEGRLMIHILGAFAEFETELRLERQREGIAKAKAEGRYKGRARKISKKDVLRMRAKGVTSAREIAKQLGCGYNAVYRVCRDGWGPAPVVKKGGQDGSVSHPAV